MNARKLFALARMFQGVNWIDERGGERVAGQRRKGVVGGEVVRSEIGVLTHQPPMTTAKMDPRLMLKYLGNSCV